VFLITSPIRSKIKTWGHSVRANEQNPKKKAQHWDYEYLINGIEYEWDNSDSFSRPTFSHIQLTWKKLPCVSGGPSTWANFSPFIMVSVLRVLLIRKLWLCFQLIFGDGQRSVNFLVFGYPEETLFLVWTVNETLYGKWIQPTNKYLQVVKCG